MTSVSVSIKRDMNAPQINQLAQSRFEKYCKAMQIDSRAGATKLLKMHQADINVAEHMSATIGVDHTKYTKLLIRLGVDKSIIR